LCISKFHKQKHSTFCIISSVTIEDAYGQTEVQNSTANTSAVSDLRCHYNHTIKLAETSHAPLPSELTVGTMASVSELVDHIRMSVLLTSSYHEWQSLITTCALLHPLSDMGSNRHPLAAYNIIPGQHQKYKLKWHKPSLTSCRVRLKDH
jgi:hypothetical protein